MEQNRPDVPVDDYDKPVGSNMPERKPLELLPEREWLEAKIVKVVYQYAMFNNKMQYITDMDDQPILDENDQPIPRKEFNITFELKDYFLPNNEPRKAWLRMSASFGDKANLPIFLTSILGNYPDTPGEIISGLEGVSVKLQLQNKPNKDKTKQPYQNVIFDAVKVADSDQADSGQNDTYEHNEAI